MDGYNAPSALHAELFEKSRRHDFLAADESVRIEQSAADDGDENDAESSAEDLRRVADDGAAGHGAEVGDDLRDGDGVGGEIVLVFDHERVEVLGAVGHEIEAGHEEDEVDEEEPVFFEGDAAFGEEGAGYVAVCFAHCISLAVGCCFWKAETEEDY